MAGLLFQNFHAQPASVHLPKFLGHFYFTNFSKFFGVKITTHYRLACHSDRVRGIPC